MEHQVWIKVTRNVTVKNEKYCTTLSNTRFMQDNILKYGLFYMWVITTWHCISKMWSLWPNIIKSFQCRMTSQTEILWNLATSNKLVAIMDSFCCSKLTVSAFLKSIDCGSAEDLRTMRNHILATKTRSITAKLHPQFSLLDNRVISFPEIHLPDEMHVGSGVWGSGGMPGVPPSTTPPHTHTRTAKWEAGDCSLWEHLFGGKRRGEEKGGKEVLVRKETSPIFLSLSGATFICSVLVPKVTAALPAWLMIWEYLQRREVFLKKNNSKTKQKQIKTWIFPQWIVQGLHPPTAWASVQTNKYFVHPLHYVILSVICRLWLRR